MNLLQRMKHYNFWVALTMAVIVLLNTISQAFDVDIDDAVINDIIMAILGIMVVLGFVQKDNYDFVDTSKLNADTTTNDDDATANTDADAENNITADTDAVNTDIDASKQIATAKTAEAYADTADADTKVDKNTSIVDATNKGTANRKAKSKNKGGTTDATNDGNANTTDGGNANATKSGKANTTDGGNTNAKNGENTNVIKIAAHNDCDCDEIDIDKIIANLKQDANNNST